MPHMPPTNLGHRNLGDVVCILSGRWPSEHEKISWGTDHIEPPVGVSPVTSGRAPNSVVQLVNTFPMRRFHDADTEEHS